MKKIFGEQAQDFLREQLADAKNGLAGTLAPYEPQSTFDNYFFYFSGNRRVYQSSTV